MAGTNDVIVIDSDDEDDDQEKDPDDGEKNTCTKLSQNQQNCLVVQFQGILTHLTKAAAIQCLNSHNWDLQRALDAALNDDGSPVLIQHIHHRHCPANQRGIASSAIATQTERADDGFRTPDDEDDLRLPTSKRALFPKNDSQKGSIISSSKRSRHYHERSTTIKEPLTKTTTNTTTAAVAADHKEPSARPEVKVLSAQWHACVQRTIDAKQEHFIDSDFPPISQSLDGRRRITQTQSTAATATTESALQCHCGIPAAAKQVQTDGPNYGRFYLTCGRQFELKRRAKVVVVRSPKQKLEPKANNNAATSPQGDNNKETHPNAVTIRNPYATKKQPATSPQPPCSSSPPTPRHQQNSSASPKASTTSSTSPSTPQRYRCNFFQWDTAGSIGADAIAGYGAISRYSSLSWQHFGLRQGCSLYQKCIIDVSQIRQGAVGNCWFLSALAVVAEKPHLIRHILPHTQLNEFGCYQINLYLDGQWQPVIVDSYLPVVLVDYDDTKKKKRNLHNEMMTRRLRGGVPIEQANNNNNNKTAGCKMMALPAFCAAPNLQLWPALTEKAYAKAHGSYQQLSGGFIAEGLQDLTGAPTETVIFQSNRFEPDTFWARLLSFYHAGFVMGVATARGGDGLVGGHAYSVLEVLEVPDCIIGEQSKVTDYFSCSSSNNNNNRSSTSTEVELVAPSEEERRQGETMQRRSERTMVRLVRIRNPWGKREWKGAWSADSERWTRALRKRLGSEQTFAKGDGTFYMSFEDMLQRFHHMDVAKTREGWCHSSTKGLLVRGSDPIASSQHLYTIESSRTTQAFVTVIQPKKRSNTTTKYWYCDPSMILLKRKREQEEWQCEACVLSGVKRQNYVEVMLDPGCTYCCVPLSCLASQRGNNDFHFRLTTYSSASVTVNKHLNDQSVRDAAVRLLHKEMLARELKLVSPVATGGILACIHGEGSLYFVAVNGAFDHFLSIKITVDLPEGLLLVLGQEDESYDVAPRSQKLCLVVSTNGKQSSTATEFKFRYMSAVVSTKRQHIGGEKKGYQRLKLYSSVNLCLSGDLLTGSIDESRINMRGGGTIDTYFWIPQLGADGISNPY